MEEIDKKIAELKTIDSAIEALEKQKVEARKAIFDYIESNKLPQYKNDNALVSYVAKKFVKVIDSQKLLDQLKEQKLVKYIEVIPAREELSDTFQKDVKEGLFTSDLVEVVETKNLAIRFTK